MPTRDSKSVEGKKPRVLIPQEKLEKRVQELAHEITRDFGDQEITVICVLKGSFPFFSDLIRHLHMPIHCEFLGLQAYGNRTESSGEVKITLDLAEPIAGKHVILVEDIVDSGLTLDYLTKSFLARGPASFKTVGLLVKPEAQRNGIEPHYVGFRVGSEYVVGYGIDYAGKLRGLPYVGTFEHDH